MHINPNIDVNEFLTAVKACSSDVILETPEGDVMSLKSEICRFVFAANANKASAVVGEVTFKNPADLELVRKYIED